MVEVKQEVSANDRSVQDNTIQDIRKKRVIWCQKGPKNIYF